MSGIIEASSPSALALDLAATKKVEIDKLTIMLKKNLAMPFPPCLDLALEFYARWIQDMDTFSNSNKTVNTPTWKQQLTTKTKSDEPVLDDQDTKKWRLRRMPRR